MTSMDFYAALEVPPDAPIEKIKQQYRLLAGMLHPDRFTKPEQKQWAEEKMRALNEAYEVLSDPGTRHEYDKRKSEPSATPSGSVASTGSLAFLARNALEVRNYREAMEFCNQLLVGDPGNWEGWMMKGEATAYLTTSDTPRIAEALQCFEKAEAMSRSLAESSSILEVIDSTRQLVISEHASFFINQANAAWERMSPFLNSWDSSIQQTVQRVGREVIGWYTLAYELGQVSKDLKDQERFLQNIAVAISRVAERCKFGDIAVDYETKAKMHDVRRHAQVQAREDALQAAQQCLANLRRIQGAKSTWANQVLASPTQTPTWADLGMWIKEPLKCPVGGDYKLGSLRDLPTCSLGGNHSL